MKSSILYIIKTKSEEKDVLKIGITNDLSKRLKAIQTGNADKVEVVHHESIPSYVNIIEMENWLHSVFGERRKTGEWFSNLSVREVRKKIFRFLLK